MVSSMSETQKTESKGSVARKKVVEYAVHKAKAGPWEFREQPAGSEQFGVVVRQLPAKRRKLSKYTREEADWLNSLVHSATKGVNKR
jgi:hypothetical protein